MRNPPLNEWVDLDAVHLLVRACGRTLNRDCQEYIVHFLPLRCCSVCEGCGWPLVCFSRHGESFVSKEAAYSFTHCRMCYNVCAHQE